MKETILFVGGFADGQRRGLSNGEQYIRIAKQPSRKFTSPEPWDDPAYKYEIAVYDRMSFRIATDANDPVEISLMALSGMTHAEEFLVAHYHPPKSAHVES